MSIKKIYNLFLCALAIGISQPVAGTTVDPKDFNFKNVSVHDPSIINDNGTYYIVGSHLAFAKSDDLINWKQLAISVRPKKSFVSRSFYNS